MAFIIKNREDPFKKYWWLILLGCLLVGFWVFSPSMGSSGASIPLAEGGLKSSTQNLSSIDTGGAAPGSPFQQLGLYAKKVIADPFASLLYQPPVQSKAKVSIVSKAASPAESLSQIAGGAASPHYLASPRPYSRQGSSFGPLNGMGDMGGGGGESGGYGGSAGGTGVYGESGPKTQIVNAQQADAAANVRSANGGGAMNALKTAQTSSMQAAAMGAGAGAAAQSAKSFDNSGSGGPELTGGPGSLPSLGSGDTAANLKGLDPTTPTAAAPPPDPQETKDNSATAQKFDLQAALLTMAVNVVAGGLMGDITATAATGMGLTTVAAPAAAAAK